MGVQNTPEFTSLWSEWLRTEDGKGYEAGWPDYATRWHAERGRVWCLERREAEHGRLAAAAKAAALLIHRGDVAAAKQTLLAAVGPQPQEEWYRVGRICDALENP